MGFIRVKEFDLCVISITPLCMCPTFCLWFFVFVYNKCLSFSSSLSLGLDDHLQKNSYRAFFIRSKRSRDSEKEYFLARDCLSFVRTPVTKSINGISFNAYRKIVRIAKKMRIWNFFFFQITFPVSECATQLLIDIYQVASWNKTTAKISTQIFTQAFF